MTMTGSMTRWGGARIARRLGRSIPFLGTAIALVTVGAAVRRKGWLRGMADTALTAVPFVGTAKTAVEVVRGRGITRDDRAGAELVVVISEPLAHRMFPDEDALGPGLDLGHSDRHRPGRQP